jgi:hypothetical protein
MASIESAQKPPHALTHAPSYTNDSLNRAPNLIKKLKLNQEPNNFGTNIIPIHVSTPTYNATQFKGAYNCYS